MSDSIKIFPASEVVDQENLVKKLIEIDNICYGEIDEKDEGVSDYWSKMHQAIFSFVAMKNDEPIGYFDFVALNQEGLKKLQAGNLRDGEMEKFIRSGDLLGEVNLYLISMAILPEYRGQGVGQRIWHTVKNYFIENNLKIKNLYATIWTQAGHTFLKKFNYKVIAKDPQGHEIVVMEMGDF